MPMQRRYLVLNIKHKLRCRSITIDGLSTDLQPHENTFEDLTKCSDTPTRPVAVQRL